MQNLTILASTVPEISLGFKIWSGSHDPDHAPFKGDYSSLCWQWDLA